MKKKLTILMLIISTMVLLFSGCAKKPVVNGNISPTPIATSTPKEKIDTSDWKVYRNDEFGFEFMYPSDWTISDPIPRSNFSISIFPPTWGSSKLGKDYYYIQIGNIGDPSLSIKKCDRQPNSSEIDLGNPILEKSACGNRLKDLTKDGTINDEVLFLSRQKVIMFSSNPDYIVDEEKKNFFKNIFQEVIQSIKLF